MQLSTENVSDLWQFVIELHPEVALCQMLVEVGVLAEDREFLAEPALGRRGVSGPDLGRRGHVAQLPLAAVLLKPVLNK